MAALRALLAIALAIIAGIGLTLLDTTPNFDDTGVVAIGLAAAAFVVVLVDGSGRVLQVATLAVLVGVWIPILEIAPPGAFGQLLALGFAAAGAIAGMLVLRATRSSGLRPASPDAPPPLAGADEPSLVPPPDDRG
jgi:hypothetical protein